MTTPTDPTDPSDPNYDISLNPPDFAFAASLDKLVGESATKALGVRATDPYAEVFVEAWRNRNIGDIIRLKIQDKDGKGDLLVASVTVSEIASRYSLMVPRKDLQDRVLVGQQEGLVTMYLELARVGSKQISRSRSVTFLLKKSSPAGFDSRPDVEGHDGLRVVAEGLPQYSTVDSYVASKGMWVLLSKHANARANDLFTVFLAGVPTPYRLSAAEAAGPGPYRVFIPPSVFRDITQFGLLPLLYTVEDVAENPPAGNTKLSAPYYLNSDLDPSLFDPPYLLVNNVETTRLNLGTQGSLPFSVSVTPPRSIRLASPPNQIVVTLTFTKNEGTKKVTRLPSFAQTQARGEIIPVSSEVFSQPGFDFVHISYEMFSSTGALLGKSGSTSVSLEGVLVVTYPAPAFDGKLGPQTIVPQNYPNGATTTVGFPSMSTAHVIQLIWRYFDGTVAVIPAQTGNANGLVQFPISATIIAQSAGQPIKLSYLVTVGGTTVASEVQVLTVQAATTNPGSPGVFATVAVGLHAHAITITKDGLLAYVGNSLDHTVSVIDINSRKVVDTIFGTPSAFQMLLNADNSRLYVSSFKAGTIAVIDTATRRLIMTMTPSGGERSAWMALNADESRLFVACSFGGFVAVHDTKTGALLNRITTPPMPEGVALNPDKTQVFISTSKETMITNANGLGGGLAKVSGYTRFTQSEGIAFNPNNKPYPRVYVTGNDSLAIIDTQTNAVTKSLSGFTYSWGATMKPKGSECYVGAVGPGGTPGNRDSLYIINTETEQVIRRYAGFDNIAGIAFTPDGEIALIVNHGTGKVSFYKT